MGDVGRWLPQEWSEIELAALHNQIAGKVAGRRCYDNGANEGRRCRRLSLPEETRGESALASAGRVWWVMAAPLTKTGECFRVRSNSLNRTRGSVKD